LGRSIQGTIVIFRNLFVALVLTPSLHLPFHPDLNNALFSWLG
jgi:hypothetical protein